MIALLTSFALAQTTEPPPPPPTMPVEEDDEFQIAFTVGPVLGLTLPGVDEQGLLKMANIFIESRQGKGVGIGMIGGFGRVDNVLSYQIGIGGRGYLVGDFDTGLLLGTEIMFVHQSGRAGGTLPESGASFGPVLGFKYTAPIGFTMDFSGGGAVRFYGEGFDTAESSFGPIAHVQFGWSA
jgi:hypothetical protein